MEKKIEITVQVEVLKNKKIVWEYLTEPEHIKNWNFASDDWFCPKAENILKIGEKFNYRMEAKDGSFGFDFWGTYTDIILYENLFSVLGDGRKLEISLKEEGNSTLIIEKFEAESENSVELQRDGWQAILNNLKKYIENS